MSLLKLQLVVLLCLAAMMSPVLSGSDFSNFKNNHHKTYSSEVEDKYRGGVYKNNKAWRDKHDSDAKATWKSGENQFSDMTTDEFKAMILNTPIT